MLQVEKRERSAKTHCLICSGDIEKSNMGSVCNPCKDKMYKFDFTSPKKAESKVTQMHKAK